MIVKDFRRGAASVAAVILVLSASAWADDDVIKVDDSALAEVVVTATRTETNLQRTPIAVTAFSGATLEQLNVTNLSDVTSMAPSLTIGPRAGTGISQGVVSIRGIGTDANFPASPAVGIYVDDVYTPNDFGNLTDLFDVERLEVLRGPQGTLFGRNTIGGAIQYVTNQPQLGELSSYVEGTFGSLHRADERAVINVPLGDVAAIRVSLASDYQGGYIYDELNNIERGSAHSKEGRFQVHLELADKLTVNAKFDSYDQTSNGRTAIPAGFGYAGFGAAFAPDGLNRFIPSNLHRFAGYDGADNFYSNSHLGQVVLGYAITDNIHFKSITAYQHEVGQINVDNDDTPLPIFEASRGLQTNDLLTQEFQVVGTSFDRLHWDGGLFYYDGSLHSQNATFSIFDAPPANEFGDSKLYTKAYAAYGQATFDLTTQLALVTGLRFTTENQELDGGEGVKLLPGAPYVNSRNFKDSSPLAGLNYQLTPATMLYVKASKGFRAGGFSPLSDHALIFNPETAWTYEAGARMQFLDGRLRVNPTYYHTFWEHVQYNTQALSFGLPLPVIANGPNVRADGGELESLWAVTKQLSLSLTGSLLNARYTTNSILALPPPLSGLPAFGLSSTLGRAPSDQFSVGGVYKVPLGYLGDLTTNLNYNWTGRQRSASSDALYVEEPSVGLLNARIEDALASGRFRIAIFATNLTNKAYINGGTDYPRGGPVPTIEENVAPPREYGVTLRVTF